MTEQKQKKDRAPITSPLEDHMHILKHGYFQAGRIMVIAIEDTLMKGWKAYISILEEEDTDLPLQEQQYIALRCGTKLYEREARGHFPEFADRAYIK